MWPKSRLGKCMVCSLGFLVLALIAIQFVPYGRDHANPSVRMEPAWDSPETRELARRACFDCHSNEVEWPWYSNIAPVSWLVQYDVDEGREELNFSEWKRGSDDGKEAAKELNKGSMPPWFYMALHPQAKLTAEEKARLISAFQRLGAR